MRGRDRGVWATWKACHRFHRGPCSTCAKGKPCSETSPRLPCTRAQPEAGGCLGQPFPQLGPPWTLPRGSKALAPAASATWHSFPSNARQSSLHSPSPLRCCLLQEVLPDHPSRAVLNLAIFHSTCTLLQGSPHADMGCLSPWIPRSGFSLPLPQYTHTVKVHLARAPEILAEST